MPKIEVHTINGFKVKKPQILSQQGDGREVKGKELFEEPYANIYICARKKSGKSVVIENIIKKTIDKNTIVIMFASTLYKDPVLKAIKHYCEQKDIPFYGYTEIKSKGVDRLQTIINTMQEGDEDEDNSDEDDEPEYLDLCNIDIEKETRKSKYITPKYLFIFDDISNELKSKSLVALLKKNRHTKSRIILSSQWLNDLLPESRKQIDYLLLFGGFSIEKLEVIHKDADLSIDLETFIKIYRYATKDRFHFLYIDCVKQEFRKDFNKQFLIPEKFE